MISFISLYQAVSLFLYLIRTAMLIYCILTWVAPRSSLCYWLQGFIQPFCAPFRQLSHWLMRRFGARFDFTVWFSLIGLSIIDQLFYRLFFWLERIF